MKAQQKKLNGCASNLLAHKDLGHFEEAHHWNIEAKFYNEKFSLVIWKWKHKRLSVWKTWCYFEAQVWKKYSNIVPSLFFSHFFIWASLSSFIFCKVRSLIPTYGGIIVFILLSSLRQCSNNEDHHTFINLQLENYKSTLRTKYDSIWMPLAVYRDMKELWMVAFPQIRCQLHDHAKQYDNDGVCHIV